MNKNDQILQNILEASKKLKDEGLIVGEARDVKHMGKFPAAVSTGHPIKPLDHRKILFEALRENPGKYGVSVDQANEILSEVDTAWCATIGGGMSTKLAEEYIKLGAEDKPLP
ncbi:hypothetical protein M5X00_24115 [Paenibacillus alvei]|uniref:Uncharacterized protein n=1 Tax=Paenibacillus alvei TaxID=44250 RepID=A0ABT4GR50_PAEAL|nr:hypothetical protein [Paenibacillus alvei]MCY9543605.1 hypothetical protein [Paenibacillus alvei]MCY9737325.1 hypothetical protein [Paenibacillus alvei]MCY9757315.1 hypothetical protein [Paenibacillus alvei]MCY9759154.1 hypothetical protein [Paenibacillus alvei]MCY9770387.1 hypothetical protein [Paenibacillus alvei]